MPHRFTRDSGLAKEFRGILAARNKAEADRLLAHVNRLGLEAENVAAEARIRAERLAGRLLSELIERGGDRKSSSHQETLTLSHLGIDRNQSARWQREFAIPEAVFEGYLKAAMEAGKPITTNGLFRFAKSAISTSITSETCAQEGVDQ